MSGGEIKLFVSDIDGCLSAPFEPYELGHLQELRRKVVTERDEFTPEFSICTGRPLAYVEAMVQAIGFFQPVLFEGGAGMYDPRDYTVRWAPGISSEERDQVKKITAHWRSHYESSDGISIDYGKTTQASIVIRDAGALKRIHAEIAEQLSEEYPLLMLADTHVSIDVFPVGLSKANGMKWLAEELGVRLDEIAYIGDSTGDIGAMELVGVGIAPSNASATVKAAADYVCKTGLIEAVHEGLDLCIARNRVRALES